MKSLIYLLVLSVLLVSCSSGDADFLSPEERAWLENRKRNLSILFGPDNPPENFSNEMGAYTGMLVDYNREMEDILGLEFNRKVFSSWSGLLEYARENRDYIILGIAQTDLRDEYLLFSSQLVDVKFVLVTRAGEQVDSIEDMIGKRYYAIRDYSIFDVRERYLPGVDLVPVDDLLKGFEAVMSGEADGFVDTSAYINYNIAYQGLKGLEIHDVIGVDVKYRIAVAGRDRMLAGIMEKALGRISPAKHRELSAVWRNVDMKRVDPRTWRILFSILGILIFLVGIVLLWVLSLKREVARKADIILRDEQKRMEADRGDALRVLAGGDLPRSEQPSHRFVRLYGDGPGGAGKRGAG